MSISVEFWIPMSPNEEMVTQLIVLAASIRMHGGKMAASGKIKALVHPDGDETPLRKRNKQLDDLGIEVAWVEKKEFEKYHYGAAGMGRMKQAFTSDVVVLIDADTLVAGSLDDIIEASYRENRLYGLIANTPPPYWQTDETSRGIWTKLFAGAGLPEPVFNCEHSGWNILFFNEDYRYCPPYFNFGVVLAPAQVISRIGQIIFEELSKVRTILPRNFAEAQFAVSLAIQRLSINCGTLDLKYNFPITHKQFLDISDHYLKDIRVFHYLGDWEGDLKRPRDFGNLMAVGDFMERCQDKEKFRSFIDALKPVYRKIAFPWLWNGYEVAEKARSLPDNISNGINQILDESTSWAREMSAENRELLNNKGQECSQLLSQVGELQAHVHDLEINTALLDKERNELNAQVNALRGSISWRITAPIRFVGKMLERLGLRHISQ